MNYDKIRHMINDFKENITGDVTSIDQIMDELANQINIRDKKILGDPEQKGFWKEEIKKVRQCHQRQDGLSDQLNDLVPVANKLGFYDAATFLNDRNK